VSGTADPITLSVFVSALSGIAEEMGAVLVRSSRSSNIKERRDCSCALFDRHGRLVAQAEHIPVHLGAMPEAVAAVIARDPRPGDVFAINDPFSGGTHLPDITIVTPIEQDGTVIGFSVSRAHHSDVGGMTPGSMPSDSRSIFQEGLIIPPIRLGRGGEIQQDLLDLILANVRTPEIRRGDLHAQLAANRVGAARLRELVSRYGSEFVDAAIDDVLAYTERRARAVIRSIPDGTYRARTEVEGDGITSDDITIACSALVDGDRIRLDFTGTAPATAGNVNCPLAVTRSACLFALRVLLPDDVPTNAGVGRALDVSAPPGSLVNAQHPSAVVAGNVETSQRIADVLLQALGQAVDLPAAGQGTMNNVIIGGHDWTYYETIGGGQGASSEADGPSGVHVGMSNTLNTPIEALELEFPLQVDRYELRYGSGGTGRHSGGDGVVRTIRVLEPATLCLVTDRRRRPRCDRAEPDRRRRGAREDDDRAAAGPDRDGRHARRRGLGGVDGRSDVTVSGSRSTAGSNPSRRCPTWSSSPPPAPRLRSVWRNTCRGAIDEGSSRMSLERRSSHDVIRIFPARAGRDRSSGGRRGGRGRHRGRASCRRARPGPASPPCRHERSTRGSGPFPRPLQGG
jgi:N-methylhydantoinase B